jgi:hypothetical protein
LSTISSLGSKNVMKPAPLNREREGRHSARHSARLHSALCRIENVVRDLRSAVRASGGTRTLCAQIENNN